MGCLSEGERAYETYFKLVKNASLTTPYPSPIPMSREVYDKFLK
jgi:hypothetical protein